MKFADLQARVNAAASAKLATDEATLNGMVVTGKFLNPAEIALHLFSGSNPVFECPTAQSGLAAKGKTLVKDGVNYTVLLAKPDNFPGGFTVLELEET